MISNKDKNENMDTDFSGRDKLPTGSKRGDSSEVFNALLEFAFDLAMVILVVFAIRTFIISPYAVNGESMENTIHDGELIIANRFSVLNVFGFNIGKVRRGDVVILRPPGSADKFFIKRVIGLPGEEILFRDGKVYIKNKEYSRGAVLVEPYLSETNKGKTFLPSSTKKKLFKIPEGHYFVMGDNRIRSSDSRGCFSVCCEGNDPFLPRENIISRSWFAFWPLYNFRAIKNGSAAYGK